MRTDAVPIDYDSDPGRFRANVESVEKYGLAADIHAEVAQRLAGEGLEPVLDVGCGEGRLINPLRARGLAVVGLDNSAAMLASVPDPRIKGDARRLPFRGDSFGGVAALYMLYHLPEPRNAIAEAYRVLRPGGLFIACAPSRYNDPELAHLFPPSPSPFDAENGPDMVAEFFANVELNRWDAPLVHLPDHEALLLYLRGRQLSEAAIEAATASVSVPLTLTKRGVLIVGHKPAHD